MTDKSDIPTSKTWEYFQTQITTKYFSDHWINCEYQPQLASLGQPVVNDRGAGV